MKKYLLLFITITTFACGSSPVFEGYHNITNETWNRSDVAEFNVEIPAAGRYVVNLCLRHTTDYELSNLWCFVSTRGTSEKPFKDTVNIKIAEPDGRWLGQGSAIKTVEQPVNPKIITLPQGTVTFRLEQGMRTECLKGVKDIGIRLERPGTIN